MTANGAEGDNSRSLEDAEALLAKVGYLLAFGKKITAVKSGIMTVCRGMQNNQIAIVVCGW